MVIAPGNIDDWSMQPPTQGSRAAASSKPTRHRSSPWAVAAHLLLIIAVPVVTWWLIGFDLVAVFGDELVADANNFGYVVQPPVISPGAEQALGVSATIVALASVIVLTVESRHRRFDRRWQPSLLYSMIAGSAAALIQRAVTAPLTGSGMGRGIALMFGTPTVIGFGVGALVSIGYVCHSTVADGSASRRQRRRKPPAAPRRRSRREDERHLG